MSIQGLHGQSSLLASNQAVSGQTAAVSSSEESREGAAEKAREASQPVAAPGQLAQYQGRNVDLSA